MNRVVIAGLSALAMALVVVILLELRPVTTDEDTMHNPVIPTATQRSVATRTDAVSAPRTDVATILARPLFSPTRRPPPAEAAAKAAPAALPRVAGILIDGGSRRVIFAAKPGGRPVIAGEGMVIDGYKVVSIAPGQVDVAGPHGRQILHPTFDPHPPEQTAAAPQPGLPGLPQLPNFAGVPGFPLPKPAR